MPTFSNHFWLQEPPAPDLGEQIVPQDIIDHNIEWDGKVWEDTGDTGNDSDDSGNSEDSNDSDNG